MFQTNGKNNVNYFSNKEWSRKFSSSTSLTITSIVSSCKRDRERYVPSVGMVCWLMGRCGAGACTPQPLVLNTKCAKMRHVCPQYSCFMCKQFAFILQLHVFVYFLICGAIPTTVLFSAQVLRRFDVSPK